MSRAEQKEQRRAALLAGAREVLAEHGLEGFTTGRVAAAGGVVQSAFYLYFPDRDACLWEVAAQVGDEVLAVIRRARQESGADPSRLVGSFADALRTLVSERATAELFLRFRREPGPMGDLFRDLVSRAVAELHADLVALGMVGCDDPAGPRLARYTVALVLGAVEGLLDGDLGDVDTVAGDLAAIAVTVLSARLP